MERRSCNRKTVELSVYVTAGTLNDMSRCIATDISTHGIFLKTDPHGVPRNKCVKLMFALRAGTSNVVRLRRATAIVTHSNKDGVGMRFCTRRKHGMGRVLAQKQKQSKNGNNNGSNNGVGDK